MPVMRGTDGTWKFWCIHKIIVRLPKELAEQFRPELTRLMTHPTRDEHIEEVDEAAREDSSASTMQAPDRSAGRAAMVGAV